MNVEVISVGTELLLGDILNTNVQFLSRELANLGINVYKQVSVGDNIDRVCKCFDEAFSQGVDLIITTGGLGPTGDDITKEACAKYFDQELVLFEDEWNKIQQKCLKFSQSIGKIPQNNIKQAMFTKNAVIIENNHGTAPGAIFEKDGKKILVMPGPPNEMTNMFYDSVLNLLRDETDVIFKSKYIRLYGIGESALELKIKHILDTQTNPTVALYAKQGEVLIRVTASANTEKDCEQMIFDKIDELKHLCGDYIYLIGDENISSSQSELVNVVSELLIEKKKTIAIAESCTGGLVSAKLISYPGISSVLLEGCVTYSNEAKISRLGVSKDTLDKYGAVSSQVACEMAEGVRKNLGAFIGLSTTGIAGPEGGSEEKPVGLVHFGISYGDKTIEFKKVFTGNRDDIRNRASIEMINRLRVLLLEDK